MAGIYGADIRVSPYVTSYLNHVTPVSTRNNGVFAEPVSDGYPEVPRDFTRSWSLSIDQRVLRLALPS